MFVRLLLEASRSIRLVAPAVIVRLLPEASRTMPLCDGQSVFPSLSLA